MSQPLPDVGPPAPDGDPADRPTVDPGPPAPDGDLADRSIAEVTADVDPDLPRFRLAYVPGSTPGKWASVWRERLPDVYLELVQVESALVASALEAGEADAAIGRLPVDKDVFSAIPLYEETSVVCFSRDHMLAALGDDEAVSSADIAEEPVWVPADDVLFAAGQAPGIPPADPDGHPLDPLPTTADVVATVAANVGLAVLPLSLARLHRRKDVTYRPLVDGPTAPVGLVWPVDRTTDLVEELIGIVRGRTVNSSRGRGVPSSARPADDGGTAAATGKAARNGKGAPGTTGGAKPRFGAGRGGAKGGGAKGGAAKGGTRGAAQRGKGARPAPKGKKKGKGR